VSITDITVRVAVIAGCALVALLVIGWRQPARGTSSAPDSDPETASEPPATLRQVLRRRALDLSALGGVALVAGVVVATLVSVVISLIVTNIIDRL
jgi:hypothetical protein